MFKFNSVVNTVLREMANFGRKEFYHGADKSHVQSFISGIKPEMAGTNHQGAGQEQGAGFYVFKDKQRALKYIQEDATAFIKDPIVVVIDEELNTDCFDIDYEAEWALVRSFIIKHIQELKSNPQYGFKQGAMAEKLGTAQISIRDSQRSGESQRSFPLQRPIDGDSQRAVAESFYHLFENIKRINPNLYNQFEDEVIDRAGVLKYNGERTIFPARIEDIQGNVLWQKNQQQPSR